MSTNVQLCIYKPDKFVKLQSAEELNRILVLFGFTKASDIGRKFASRYHD